VDETCAEPPAIVGNALGGAIAARGAIERPAALRALVLVDALGLTDFAPAPRFGAAMQAFLAAPSVATHDELWRHCAHDLDGMRSRMREQWSPFAAYNVERARTPSVMVALGALMEAFGARAIPGEDLGRISVPTSLIWGREDVATPLAAAEAVGAARGWPLHVVEDCADDPPMEQPEAFLRALDAALARRA
jgi:pimeloyl-ACP methyl ester carboxylesterase